MIKNRETLLSHGDTDLREPLISIADSMLEEIKADRIVRRSVKYDGNKLEIMNKKINMNFDRVLVVGFGKASVSMALAIEDLLGNEIDDGMVNSPYTENLKKIKVNVVPHPLPDESTVQASKKIVEIVKEAGKRDLVIVLLSGGASSLFEIPRDGMSIQEERKIVGKALMRGVDIIELNHLRMSLSKVKGGKFAKYIAPAKCVSLIISDVIGPPEFVGSGPTYGHPCENLVLADNKYALQIAKHIAKSLGFVSRISSKPLHGEPKNVARKIANIPKGVNIWGGETTVRVKGNGKGGRNQELALYLSKYLHGKSGFICIGTDGIDGPTNAAGGIVDWKTTERAERMKIWIEHELNNNNSYHALKNLGDLVITGPTGSNLADVCIGLKL